MRDFSKFTVQRFEEAHRRFTEEALQIALRKNHDYANPNATSLGVFGNLAWCEASGLCPTEDGLLIRLQDKMARLVTVHRKGSSEVKDESLRDTRLDMVNYLAFLDLCAELKFESLVDIPRSL